MGKVSVNTSPASLPPDGAKINTSASYFLQESAESIQTAPERLETVIAGGCLSYIS